MWSFETKKKKKPKGDEEQDKCPILEYFGVKHNQNTSGKIFEPFLGSKYKIDSNLSF
jgi:hypothetical protein